MPQQIFQVLRCYKCVVFQVHQAKKSNKWACKMCGEKQSVKRHYGIGTGKECRLHVQRLNGLRGDLEDSKTSVKSDSEDEEEDKAESPVYKNRQLQKSQWSKFVEKEPEQNYEVTSTMYLNDVEVVLEPPQKRKCGRRASKTSKFTKCYLAHNSHNDLSDDDEGQNSVIDVSVGNDYVVNETRLQMKKFVPPTLQTNSKWDPIKQESIGNTTCGDFPQDFQSNTLPFSELQKSQPKAMQPLNNSKHEDTWTNKSSDTKVKHSKWSQFVDEEVIDDDNGSEDSEIDLNAHKSFKNSHTVTSNVSNEHGDAKENLQTMFTLSDDYDLDNVLDF